ncbi:ATP synthase F1 subunit epsilon [Candidatus Roizmanbacteria bacterium CG02_land_8_20_14_3_00_36_15]|uniref:ATP synthase epsilon chain n=2 Tax=Candidatus Roizmaniibacteriota TaxID=1752723 RepID=A0A2M8KMH8_9BACT|nr:MAG: ATP synthase F1 subunit epsilon [Candidatus Roizmanbacteria bacterium CG03_land_8_20_14_0_80_36_21]PIV37656.1 MAG: ATP synthase F1 subunit epsilon [Candidatus Roizmanbacteria bacterium CG02_land_8_20_14_3_00_36_15]PIY69931.1 MAG: ATP synthase F1 subunit epsilon [Candidatus Roizmanbacteria bacterium CG_4_10_14_0_8_um_filter_36_36]PJA53486.1 MAG: ATP synthase F1 subunit epsilon [Candidatus Roizmanbacteria bacterium CG_4_9_14_3_um_filter_36_11]PJC82179.1 MAG: ATP synthase F1 subunit epsilo
MDILKLKIITPKKIALEEDVISVTAPSSEGEITILPKHMNLFALLDEGIVKIVKKTGEDFLAIGGGYLQTDGDEVNVLVSRAYGQTDIDIDLTNKAVEEAKKIISQTKDISQRAQANVLLRRSMLNIKLLKKRKRSL